MGSYRAARRFFRPRRGVYEWLVSRPWWLSAGMGGLSLLFGWVLLHYLHLPGRHGSSLRQLLDQGLHSQLLHPLWGLLALFFTFAACVSASRQIKRDQLLCRQRNLASIKALDWQAFEQLVACAYQRLGYVVQETGSGADGGVDLVLTRANKTTLVQCKRWLRSSVGVPVVREMFGIMHAAGADAVKIVCVGRFTREAVEFARGKPIELVDGPALSGSRYCRLAATSAYAG